MTASAPVIAATSESRSSMLPRAISTPLASSRDASEPGRTSARTFLPRASSSSTTWPPSEPVPPTTRTGLSVMIRSCVVDGLAWRKRTVVAADAEPPVEVDTPRDRRRDLHDLRRAAHTWALDQFGGAVDAQVARGPWTDRGQAIDDDGDLGVALPDVRRAPRVAGVETADP